MPSVVSSCLLAAENTMAEGDEDDELPLSYEESVVQQEQPDEAG